MYRSCSVMRLVSLFMAASMHTTLIAEPNPPNASNNVVTPYPGMASGGNQSNPQSSSVTTGNGGGIVGTGPNNVLYNADINSAAKSNARNDGADDRNASRNKKAADAILQKAIREEQNAKSGTAVSEPGVVQQQPAVNPINPPLPPPPLEPTTQPGSSDNIPVNGEQGSGVQESIKAVENKVIQETAQPDQPQTLVPEQQVEQLPQAQPSETPVEQVQAAVPEQQVEQLPQTQIAESTVEQVQAAVPEQQVEQLPQTQIAEPTVEQAQAAATEQPNEQMTPVQVSEGQNEQQNQAPAPEQQVEQLPQTQIAEPTVEQVQAAAPEQQVEQMTPVQVSEGQNEQQNQAPAPEQQVEQLPQAQPSEATLEQNPGQSPESPVVTSVAMEETVNQNPTTETWESGSNENKGEDGATPNQEERIENLETKQEINDITQDDNLGVSTDEKFDAGAGDQRGKDDDEQKVKKVIQDEEVEAGSVGKSSQGADDSTQDDTLGASEDEKLVAGLGDQREQEFVKTYDDAVGGSTGESNAEEEINRGDEQTGEVQPTDEDLLPRDDTVENKAEDNKENADNPESGPVADSGEKQLEEPKAEKSGISASDVLKGVAVAGAAGAAIAGGLYVYGKVAGSESGERKKINTRDTSLYGGEEARKKESASAKAMRDGAAAAGQTSGGSSDAAVAGEGEGAKEEKSSKVADFLYEHSGTIAKVGAGSLAAGALAGGAAYLLDNKNNSAPGESIIDKSKDAVSNIGNKVSDKVSGAISSVKSKFSSLFGGPSNTSDSKENNISQETSPGVDGTTPSETAGVEEAPRKKVYDIEDVKKLVEANNIAATPEEVESLLGQREISRDEMVRLVKQGNGNLEEEELSKIVPSNTITPQELYEKSQGLNLTLPLETLQEMAGEGGVISMSLARDILHTVNPDLNETFLKATLPDKNTKFDEEQAKKILSEAGVKDEALVDNLLKSRHQIPESHVVEILTGIAEFKEEQEREEKAKDEREKNPESAESEEVRSQKHMTALDEIQSLMNGRNPYEESDGGDETGDRSEKKERAFVGLDGETPLVDVSDNTQQDNGKDSEETNAKNSANNTYDPMNPNYATPGALDQLSSQPQYQQTPTAIDQLQFGNSKGISSSTMLKIGAGTLGAGAAGLLLYQNREAIQKSFESGVLGDITGEVGDWVSENKTTATIGALAAGSLGLFGLSNLTGKLGGADSALSMLGGYNGFNSSGYRFGTPLTSTQQIGVGLGAAGALAVGIGAYNTYSNNKELEEKQEAADKKVSEEIDTSRKLMKKSKAELDKVQVEIGSFYSDKLNNLKIPYEQAKEQLNYATTAREDAERAYVEAQERLKDVPAEFRGRAEQEVANARAAVVKAQSAEKAAKEDFAIKEKKYNDVISIPSKEKKVEEAQKEVQHLQAKLEEAKRQEEAIAKASEKLKNASSPEKKAKAAEEYYKLQEEYQKLGGTSSSFERDLASANNKLETAQKEHNATKRISEALEKVAKAEAGLPETKEELDMARQELASVMKESEVDVALSPKEKRELSEKEKSLAEAEKKYDTSKKTFSSSISSTAKIDELKKALEKDPGNPDLVQKLQDAQDELHEKATKLNELEKKLAEDPDNKELANEYAKAKGEFEEFSKAPSVGEKESYLNTATVGGALAAVAGGGIAASMGASKNGSLMGGGAFGAGAMGVGGLGGIGGYGMGGGMYRDANGNLYNYTGTTGILNSTTQVGLGLLAGGAVTAFAGNWIDDAAKEKKEKAQNEANSKVHDAVEGARKEINQANGDLDKAKAAAGDFYSEKLKGNADLTDLPKKEEAVNKAQAELQSTKDKLEEIDEAERAMKEAEEAMQSASPSEKEEASQKYEAAKKKYDELAKEKENLEVKIEEQTKTLEKAEKDYDTASKLSEALEDISKAEANLPESQKELDEAKKKLYDTVKEGDVNLNLSEDEKKKLEEHESKIDEAQKNLDKKKDNLEEAMGGSASLSKLKEEYEKNPNDPVAKAKYESAKEEFHAKVDRLNNAEAEYAKNPNDPEVKKEYEAAKQSMEEASVAPETGETGHKSATINVLGKDVSVGTDGVKFNMFGKEVDASWGKIGAAVMTGGAMAAGTGVSQWAMGGTLGRVGLGGLFGGTGMGGMGMGGIGMGSMGAMGMGTNGVSAAPGTMSGTALYGVGALAGAGIGAAGIKGLLEGKRDFGTIAAVAGGGLLSIGSAGLGIKKVFDNKAKAKLINIENDLAKQREAENVSQSSVIGALGAGSRPPKATEAEKKMVAIGKGVKTDTYLVTGPDGLTHKAESYVVNGKIVEVTSSASNEDRKKYAYKEDNKQASGGSALDSLAPQTPPPLPPKPESESKKVKELKERPLPPPPLPPKTEKATSALDEVGIGQSESKHVEELKKRPLPSIPGEKAGKSDSAADSIGTASKAEGASAEGKSGPPPLPPKPANLTSKIQAAGTPPPLPPRPRSQESPEAIQSISSGSEGPGQSALGSLGLDGSATAGTPPPLPPKPGEKAAGTPPPLPPKPQSQAGSEVIQGVSSGDDGPVQNALDALGVGGSSTTMPSASVKPTPPPLPPKPSKGKPVSADKGDGSQDSDATTDSTDSSGGGESNTSGLASKTASARGGNAPQVQQSPASSAVNVASVGSINPQPITQVESLAPFGGMLNYVDSPSVLENLNLSGASRDHLDYMIGGQKEALDRLRRENIESLKSRTDGAKGAIDVILKDYKKNIDDIEPKIEDKRKERDNATARKEQAKKELDKLSMEVGAEEVMLSDQAKKYLSSDYQGESLKSVFDQTIIGNEVDENSPLFKSLVADGLTPDKAKEEIKALKKINDLHIEKAKAEDRFKALEREEKEYSDSITAAETELAVAKKRYDELSVENDPEGFKKDLENEEKALNEKSKDLDKQLKDKNKELKDLEKTKPSGDPKKMRQEISDNERVIKQNEYTLKNEKLTPQQKKALEDENARLKKENAEKQEQLKKHDDYNAKQTTALEELRAIQGEKDSVENSKKEIVDRRNSADEQVRKSNEAKKSDSSKSGSGSNNKSGGDVGDGKGSGSEVEKVSGVEGDWKAGPSALEQLASGGSMNGSESMDSHGGNKPGPSALDQLSGGGSGGGSTNNPPPLPPKPDKTPPPLPPKPVDPSGDFNGTGNTSSEKAQSLLDKIKSGVAKVGGVIADNKLAVGGAVAALGAVAGGGALAAYLMNNGNAVEGIISGVGDSAKSIWDTIKEAANGAADSVKNLIGAGGKSGADSGVASFSDPEVQEMAEKGKEFADKASDILEAVPAGALDAVKEEFNVDLESMLKKIQNGAPLTEEERQAIESTEFKDHVAEKIEKAYDVDVLGMIGEYHEFSKTSKELLEKLSKTVGASTNLEKLKNDENARSAIGYVDGKAARIGYGNFKEMIEALQNGEGEKYKDDINKMLDDPKFKEILNSVKNNPEYGNIDFEAILNLHVDGSARAQKEGKAKSLEAESDKTKDEISKLTNELQDMEISSNEKDAANVILGDNEELKGFDVEKFVDAIKKGNLDEAIKNGDIDEATLKKILDNEDVMKQLQNVSPNLKEALEKAGEVVQKSKTVLDIKPSQIASDARDALKKKTEIEELGEEILKKQARGEELTDDEKEVLSHYEETKKAKAELDELLSKMEQGKVITTEEYEKVMNNIDSLLPDSDTAALHSEIDRYITEVRAEVDKVAKGKEEQKADITKEISNIKKELSNVQVMPFEKEIAKDIFSDAPELKGIDVDKLISDIKEGKMSSEDIKKIIANKEVMDKLAQNCPSLHDAVNKANKVIDKTMEIVEIEPNEVAKKTSDKLEERLKDNKNPPTKEELAAYNDVKPILDAMKEGKVIDPELIKANMDSIRKVADLIDMDPDALLKECTDYAANASSKISEVNEATSKSEGEPVVEKMETPGYTSKDKAEIQPTGGAEYDPRNSTGSVAADKVANEGLGSLRLSEDEKNATSGLIDSMKKAKDLSSAIDVKCGVIRNPDGTATRMSDVLAKIASGTITPAEVAAIASDPELMKKVEEFCNEQGKPEILTAIKEYSNKADAAKKSVDGFKKKIAESDGLKKSLDQIKEKHGVDLESLVMRMGEGKATPEEIKAVMDNPELSREFNNVCKNYGMEDVYKAMEDFNKPYTEEEAKTAADGFQKTMKENAAFSKKVEDLNKKYGVNIGEVLDKLGKGEATKEDVKAIISGNPLLAKELKDLMVANGLEDAFNTLEKASEPLSDIKAADKIEKLSKEVGIDVEKLLNDIKSGKGPSYKELNAIMGNAELMEKLSKAAPELGIDLEEVINKYAPDVEAKEKEIEKAKNKDFYGDKTAQTMLNSSDMSNTLDAVSRVEGSSVKDLIERIANGENVDKEEVAKFLNDPKVRGELDSIDKLKGTNIVQMLTEYPDKRGVAEVKRKDRESTALVNVLLNGGENGSAHQALIEADIALNSLKPKLSEIITDISNGGWKKHVGSIEKILNSNDPEFQSAREKLQALGGKYGLDITAVLDNALNNKGKLEKILEDENGEARSSKVKDLYGDKGADRIVKLIEDGSSSLGNAWAQVDGLGPVKDLLQKMANGEALTEEEIDYVVSDEAREKIEKLEKASKVDIDGVIDGYISNRDVKIKQHQKNSADEEIRKINSVSEGDVHPGLAVAQLKLEDYGIDDLGRVISDINAGAMSPETYDLLKNNILGNKDVEGILEEINDKYDLDIRSILEYGESSYLDKTKATQEESRIVMNDPKAVEITNKMDAEPGFRGTVGGIGASYGIDLTGMLTRMANGEAISEDEIKAITENKELIADLKDIDKTSGTSIVSTINNYSRDREIREVGYRDAQNTEKIKNIFANNPDAVSFADAMLKKQGISLTEVLNGISGENPHLYKDQIEKLLDPNNAAIQKIMESVESNYDIDVKSILEFGKEKIEKTDAATYVGGHLRDMRASIALEQMAGTNTETILSAYSKKYDIDVHELFQRMADGEEIKDEEVKRIMENPSLYKDLGALSISSGIDFTGIIETYTEERNARDYLKKKADADAHIAKLLPEEGEVHNAVAYANVLLDDHMQKYGMSFEDLLNDIKGGDITKHEGLLKEVLDNPEMMNIIKETDAAHGVDIESVLKSASDTIEFNRKEDTAEKQKKRKALSLDMAHLSALDRADVHSKLDAIKLGSEGNTVKTLIDNISKGLKPNATEGDKERYRHAIQTIKDNGLLNEETSVGQQFLGIIRDIDKEYGTYMEYALTEHTNGSLEAMRLEVNKDVEEAEPLTAAMTPISYLDDLEGEKHEDMKSKLEEIKVTGSWNMKDMMEALSKGEGDPDYEKASAALKESGVMENEEFMSKVRTLDAENGSSVENILTMAKERIPQEEIQKLTAKEKVSDNDNDPMKAVPVEVKKLIDDLKSQVNELQKSMAETKYAIESTKELTKETEPVTVEHLIADPKFMEEIGKKLTEQFEHERGSARELTHEHASRVNTKIHNTSSSSENGKVDKAA